MAGPLGDCLRHLCKQELAADPEDPCFVLAWLKLADDLQLENLRDMCTAEVRRLAASRHLAQAIIAHPTRTTCTLSRCSFCNEVLSANYPRAGTGRGREGARREVGWGRGRGRGGAGRGGAGRGGEGWGGNASVVAVHCLRCLSAPQQLTKVSCSWCRQPRP